MGIRGPPECHHGMHLNSAFAVVFDLIMCTFTLSHLYQHTLMVNVMKEQTHSHTKDAVSGAVLGFGVLLQNALTLHTCSTNDLNKKFGNEVA